MSVQLQANGQTLYTQSGFSVSSTGPQTLMCWINANTGNWTTTRSMCGLYSSSNVDGGAGCAAQIGARSGNGNVCAWEWGGTVMVQSTGFTPPIGSWFHAAYTYDGTTARIYINGVLNNSTAFAKNTGNFNMVFVNGYIFGGTAESSEFMIDGIIAYNRVLNANEILSIYASQGERDGNMLGCVARFPLNGRAPGYFVLASADDSVYNQNLLPQHNGAVTQPGGTGWVTGSTATIVSTSVSAPDQSTTATNITFSSASQTTSSEFLSVLTTTANTAYTGMFYIQNNGSTGSIQLMITDSGQANYAACVLNLTTGTVTSTSSLGSVTTVSTDVRTPRGGWITLYLTATFTAAVTIGVSANGATGSSSANFNAWNFDVYPMSEIATYQGSVYANSNNRPAQI